MRLVLDTSLPSRRVTRALDAVMFERGRPEKIRMDNGSELTSRHFLAWGIARRVELTHIQRGKPVQNAFVENASWFQNLWEARRRIEGWRQEYNRERPHSSLNYRTPWEFAQAFIAGRETMLKV